MRFCTLGLLLAASTAPALAQDAPPPPWSGEASAGLIVTTGNSESTTVNAKAEVVYQSERWRNTFAGCPIRALASVSGCRRGARSTSCLGPC